MLKRSRNHTRGQALVEFALILPIFLLILLGILDLGRAVYYSSTLNNAAREASRLGITDQMCQDLVNVARQHSVGVASSATVTVKVLHPDGTVRGSCPASPSATDFVTAVYGDVMDVTVQYTYRAATPVIGNLVGPIALKGESKFPIEAVCTVPAQTSCPLGD